MANFNGVGDSWGFSSTLVDFGLLAEHHDVQLPNHFIYIVLKETAKLSSKFMSVSSQSSQGPTFLPGLCGHDCGFQLV